MSRFTGYVHTMMFRLKLAFVAMIASAVVALMDHPSMAQALPPDSAYVQVEGDHLVLDGMRVRYWGLVTAYAARANFAADETPEQLATRVDRDRRAIDLFTDRLGEMGFNLVRSWEGRYPNQQGLPLLYSHDYHKGDGSLADSIAYAHAKFDEAGIKLWMSSTNGLGDITPDDVDVLDDPATADAWRAAMTELVASRGGSFPVRGRGTLLATFDERTEALWIERLRLLTDFPNHYKGGMRLGDDPQIIVWELTNEEFPFRHFFAGRWQSLPPYFRNKLLARWNDFLNRKYASEAELIAAWGFLLPGESLDEGTVALLPLGRPQTGELAINDTNPAVIESLRSHAQRYTRDDFNRRRGEDVSEFACELIIGHKQRLAAALRGMGKSCALSPVVFDSGNAFQIQEAWMHQHADAVSTCSYTKGMGHDPTHRRFPFYSQLDDYPRTSWGVPWFEQSTARGKPHFVYETMIDNRTKYRAEYPMRVAALAGIQDWDIVVWHTYPGRDANPDSPKPFDQQLNAGGDYLTIRGDEVIISALRAAGEVFRHGHAPPAPDPTVYHIGRRTLHDPRSMNYGKSYGDFADSFIHTTYRHGSRVWIDPDAEEDAVQGPVIRPGVYNSNPVKPNHAITYDWQRAFLKIDAPGAASYTGFFGEYGHDAVTFEHDVRFTDISVNNPYGMAYHVTEDERYVSITLASCDGLPLHQSRHAVISAVSTSFNTGYTLDLTRSNPGRQSEGPQDGPLREFFGAWTIGGKAPTLVARVGVTVHAPAIDGMTYIMSDFQRRTLAEGAITDGKLTIPAELPVFLVELKRP
jgi:hypothetical protein